MVPASGGAAGSAIEPPRQACGESCRRVARAIPDETVWNDRAGLEQHSGRLTTGAPLRVHPRTTPRTPRPARHRPRWPPVRAVPRERATMRQHIEPDTPTNGFPAAKASPCIVAMPMRRPVNEPGPVATAKMSMSASARSARIEQRHEIAGQSSACALGASLTCSHTTRPSRASAQLPDEVVVSRARTSTLDDNHQPRG